VEYIIAKKDSLMELKINETLLKFNLATENDLVDVFLLSNDPVVRRASFTPQQIDFSSHVEWFVKKTSDKNVAFLIVREIENNFVGYVRFEKESGSLDKVFVVSVHLTKDFRGRGLGAKIIFEATKLILQQHRGAKVYALVKKDNIASYKSFLKAGYLLEKECVEKKFDCLILKCEE
jgi:RimJ/RimL family protein N-acetyltransferase